SAHLDTTLGHKCSPINRAMLLGTRSNCKRSSLQEAANGDAGEGQVDEANGLVGALVSTLAAGNGAALAVVLVKVEVVSETGGGGDVELGALANKTLAEDTVEETVVAGSLLLVAARNLLVGTAVLLDLAVGHATEVSGDGAIVAGRGRDGGDESSESESELHGGGFVVVLVSRTGDAG
ncbi:hypothetical protein ACR8HY_22420, partial [Salmonella enterica subsp. enterica serovar Paratyphi A]